MEMPVLLLLLHMYTVIITKLTGNTSSVIITRDLYTLPGGDSQQSRCNYIPPKQYSISPPTHTHIAIGKISSTVAINAGNATSYQLPPCMPAHPCVGQWELATLPGRLRTWEQCDARGDLLGKDDGQAPHRARGTAWESGHPSHPSPPLTDAV